MESIKERQAKAAPALATVAAVRRPSITRQLLGVQNRASEGTIPQLPWASPVSEPPLFVIKDLSVKEAPRPVVQTEPHPAVHLYATMRD